MCTTDLKKQYTIISRDDNELTVKHEECKGLFKIDADSFGVNLICKVCYNNPMKRMHPDVFAESVKQLTNDTIKVVKGYFNMRTKVILKHDECQQEFPVNPRKFLDRPHCRVCRPYVAGKKSQEEFEDDIYKLVGNEYSVIGDYINNKTPIEMIHNVCGEPFEVVPNSFTSKGKRCRCNR